MSDAPIRSEHELQAAREAVIRELSAHFAEDHLSVEELEARIASAYRASTPAALTELVSGLPALEITQPPGALQNSETPAGATRRKNVLALFGGVARRGAWRVPQRIRVIAIMGGVELDLRSAELSPGVTEIRAFALMGGIVVRVPRGMRVESDGFAMLGGFEDQPLPATSSPAPADAPLVRLTGVAFMGGVEVRVERSPE